MPFCDAVFAQRRTIVVGGEEAGDSDESGVPGFWSLVLFRMLGGRKVSVEDLAVLHHVIDVERRNLEAETGFSIILHRLGVLGTSVSAHADSEVATLAPRSNSNSKESRVQVSEQDKCGS